MAKMKSNRPENGIFFEGHVTIQVSGNRKVTSELPIPIASPAHFDAVHPLISYTIHSELAAQNWGQIEAKHKLSHFLFLVQHLIVQLDTCHTVSVTQD